MRSRQTLEAFEALVYKGFPVRRALERALRRLAPLVTLQTAFLRKSLPACGERVRRLSRVGLLVAFEGALVCKGLSTRGALVRLFSSVDHLVPLELMTAREGPAARAALKALLALVDPLVPQGVVARHGLAADGAVVRLPGVDPLVLPHQVSVGEALPAHVAHVALLSRHVDLLVDAQTAGLRERLAADLALARLLARVDALVLLEAGLHGEGLPADGAQEGPLSGVGSLVHFESGGGGEGLAARVARVRLLLFLFGWWSRFVLAVAVVPEEQQVSGGVVRVRALVVHEQPVVREAPPTGGAQEAHLAVRVRSHVVLEIALVSIGLATQGTHERLLARMGPLVTNQVRAPRKRLVAHAASMRLLSRVGLVVPLQVVFVCEGSSALQAGVWSLCAVRGLVALHGVLVPEPLATRRAEQVVASVVDLLVFTQGAGVGERLAAHRAQVGLLTCVSAVVRYQPVTQGEHLATYLAAVRAVLRLLVLGQLFLLRERLPAGRTLEGLVVQLGVLLQVGAPREGLVARGALIGFLPGVDAVVTLEVAAVGKGPLAHVALVWLFSCVKAVVDLQSVLVGEGFSAQSTQIRLIIIRVRCLLVTITIRSIRMNLQRLLVVETLSCGVLVHGLLVFGEGARVREGLPARWTHVLILPSVEFLVHLKRGLVFKGLLARLALVGFFSGVCPLVSLQAASVGEGFPAGGTLVRLLSRVDAVVTLEVAPVPERLPTRHALVQLLAFRRGGRGCRVILGIPLGVFLFGRTFLALFFLRVNLRRRYP